MEGLLFLFGLFLALGLFFLSASFLKLPTLGAAKAMLGTVKQERKAGRDRGRTTENGGDYGTGTESKP